MRRLSTNTVLVYCHMCGKEYVKRVKRRMNKRAVGIRPAQSITCSKFCSKVNSLMDLGAWNRLNDFMENKK